MSPKSWFYTEIMAHDHTNVIFRSDNFSSQGAEKSCRELATRRVRTKIRCKRLITVARKGKFVFPKGKMHLAAILFPPRVSCAYAAKFCAASASLLEKITTVLSPFVSYYKNKVCTVAADLGVGWGGGEGGRTDKNYQ